VLHSAENLLVILHDNECRQITFRAAEAIRYPCAHRRPARQNRAGIHLADSSDVIDGVALHGSDHGEIVGVLRNVGKPIRNPQAALTVLLENTFRWHQPILVRAESSNTESFRMK